MQVKPTEKTKFIFQRNVLYTPFTSKGLGAPTGMIKSHQFYFTVALQLWDLVCFILSKKKSFLSAIQQLPNGCHLTKGLPFNFTSSTNEQWDNSSFQKSSYNIVAVLRNRVFQQSSMFSNMCVLKVPKKALLNIISHTNQLESLHPPSD